MAHSAMKIQTVIQYCQDPEKVGDWYADFLGLTRAAPGPFFVLEGGGALFIAPGEPGTGRGGTAVCFAVSDLDAAYKERLERGYKFNEEPYEVPGGWFVTINDPEGNIVGLQDERGG